MNRALLNVILFQIGWFACVLGAARGLPWLGPVVVALALGLHLALAHDRFAEARLLAGAALLGFFLDSAQAAAGLFAFATASTVAWLSPPWMVALWPNFATTLHTSLQWLTGRYGLASALGAVGGPLSYYAGGRLGALSFPAEPLVSLLIIGLVWAIATPLLLKLAAARL